MTIYSNTFASQSHNVDITKASTAADGAQITTSAGTTTIPVQGDKSHFGMSMRVGAVAAGETRPIQLAFTSATSAASSIEFMIESWPTGANAMLATLMSNSGIPIGALQLTPTGTVVLSTRSGTVLRTSTAKLALFKRYRFDAAVGGIGTAAGSVQLAVSTPDQAAFAGIPDGSGRLTATGTADFSTYTGVTALNFGYQQGGGTMGRTWWWAPRVDDGTITPVVSWMAPAPIGAKRRVMDLTVLSGSATASGTRSGDTAGVNAADLVGAAGDDDAATVVDCAAGTQLFADMGRVVLSGDLTLTISGAANIAAVQLKIDGVNVGAAKAPTGETVTWTKAEQGNPAANSAHSVSMLVS